MYLMYTEYTILDICVKNEGEHVLMWTWAMWTWAQHTEGVQTEANLPRHKLAGDIFGNFFRVSRQNEQRNDAETAQKLAL